MPRLKLKLRSVMIEDKILIKLEIATQELVEISNSFISEELKGPWEKNWKIFFEKNIEKKIK